ncbi:MAG: hypothetical protein BWY76_00697 [bacterium ADurb.Bin429]|nr:MAG: hypothetical protein BWY76_00697 [bacterium ADurb.Bin429]
MELTMELPLNTPQYFFDDALIADHRRLTRRWLPATIFPQPVIVPDRPWEGRMVVLYGTVVPVPDGGWRMYYTNFTPGATCPVMLATSTDGIRWEKPELGIVEWRGSTANNIVISEAWFSGEPSVIYEPEDAAYPYKAVLFQTPDSTTHWAGNWGLYGYRSADGLRWERMPAMLIQAGDRTNMMAGKVDGQYVTYTRHKDMFTHTGTRAVYRTESADFQHWSDLELVLRPDLEDEPEIEYYGMSVFKRHGWFFGLLEYWDCARDVIQTCLMVSRDGKQWRHTSRQPFIAAAYDWNQAWSTCASNGPILIGDSMLFYFGGRWQAHGYDTAQQYGAIGYASLPTDRFCALEAGAGGRLDTVPLQWPGGDLLLNADTRDSFASHPWYLHGEIAVEILGADGEPLPDWSGDRKAVWRGNTHCRGAVHHLPVIWPGERGLDALRGQTIQLRFHLTHARLFTFEAHTS